MSSTKGARVARVAGCLLGIGLAGAVLVASKPAQGGTAVGAELTMHAELSGELRVSPASPTNFLHARSLRPGESTTGTFQLTNLTGSTLASSPELRSSAHELDQALQVQVTWQGGSTQDTLGRLAGPSAEPILLGPGKTTPVSVRATLPADPPEGWQAALVDVSLVPSRTAPSP